MALESMPVNSDDVSVVTPSDCKYSQANVLDNVLIRPPFLDSAYYVTCFE